MGSELNPFFFVAIFVLAFAGLFLANTSWAGKFFSSPSVSLYYAGSFVLCGAVLHHLSPFGILLQVGLWMVTYWASAVLLRRDLVHGRAVLTSLMSSIALYAVSKVYHVSNLQLSSLGYATTILFGVGEVTFLLLLVYFTADTIYASAMHARHVVQEPQVSDDHYQPLVSIHLPISNEPVDIVTQTLSALARLSYPCYEVIVVDNNTHNEALWKPVADLCTGFGFRFIHIDSLAGYKAGALNVALEHTAPGAELIAVVDADYELLPNFVQDAVPAFQDSSVAYLQTSQRHRNSQTNQITRAFNPVYDFFYDITMLARSQRNSSIFAGCAGLIRRSALREAGGWAEWSITEDAELSLRLLALGYKGIYINHSYGSGLMPETFRDVQKQWSRYFFGGLEITYRHLWSALLARNRLSFMQRLDFVAAGLIVLGAAVMFISSAGIIITALTYSILQTQQTALAGDMLYVLTAFSDWLIIYNIYQAFGVLLLMLVFRGTYHFPWKDAFSCSLSFQSLLTTQARAAFALMTGGRQAFIRTPKRTDGSTPSRDWVQLELVLCAAMGISLLMLFWVAPSSPLIAGYLSLGLWQMLIYGITAGWSLLSP